MPDDPNALVQATIDDYILSLAEGIAHAQRALDGAKTFDAQGRPGASYYLPKLEFELRVAAQMVDTSTMVDRYPVMREGGGKNAVMFSSPAPGSTNSTEIISTIRGTFVAIPPDQGRPPVLLTSEVAPLAPAGDGSPRFRVRVRLRNTANEPQANLNVEFNLDEELTASMRAQDRHAAVAAGTALTLAAVLTDTSGIAESILSLDPREPVGSRVAVTVNGAGRTDTHTVQRA